MYLDRRHFWHFTQFQPTKQKVKKKADFNPKFQFVSSVEEYNKNTWDDISKYIRRNVKRTLDEKIERKRAEAKVNGKAEDVATDSEQEDKENENVSELEISEDELKKDNIKTKQKKFTKKQKSKQEEEVVGGEGCFEWEEPATHDEHASFYTMNLSRPLLKAVSALNYVHPTPVQAATIPVALAGRDVCACAATGTGKTAAYMLPILERLLYKTVGGDRVTRNEKPKAYKQHANMQHARTRPDPRVRPSTANQDLLIRYRLEKIHEQRTPCKVVVLVPTRELGAQVHTVARQLAQFTAVTVGLSVGGLDVKYQEGVLRRCPDVVVATPGRLIDHLRNTPSFSLHAVEVLVLDEADRMLDEYFAEQMKEIIKMCSPKRQTMLFSATMSDDVRELAAVSLTRPVRLFLDSNKDVAFNLRQEFVRIRAGRESDREALLAALVCRTFRHRAIVFVQTKRQAHRLHVALGLLGVRVAELHGALTQPQRLDSLRRFRDEQADVLVATDVAARGLDIPGVRTVLNFTLPATLEQYIHRVGRTARAGRAGVSVSLAGEAERALVRAVVRRARSGVKARQVPPDIVAKYRDKLARLEPQIATILDEEYADKQLNKMEKQASKLEDALKKEGSEGTAAKTPEVIRQHSWFQTPKQKREEKQRLALTQHPAYADKRKGKGKKRKNYDSDNESSTTKKRKENKHKAKDTPEERVRRDMEKVALLQSRIAKRKNKQKRIRAVPDETGAGGAREATAPLKRHSNFAAELADTSRATAKRLRYDANKAQKATRHKGPPQKGMRRKGHAQKVKAVGKPPSSKRNARKKN